MWDFQQLSTGYLFSLSEHLQDKREDNTDSDENGYGVNGHIRSVSKTLSLSSTSTRHVNIMMQIFILMKKRFIIQKRDKKGGFFLIILPVILISFVLLVLLIEVPLAGPPISLSLSLYTSPSKFPKLHSSEHELNGHLLNNLQSLVHV